ncbi:MAG: UpxY family transcription antiterminator [Calditrichaeota bacterium]|nr:MAG: UpxY family transcription antiterminator [Calditrichota bacterium]
MEKWYVLYTRPRHEKKVRDGLIEKNIEVFLPLLTKTLVYKNRKKKSEVPLFNSYLFARFDYKNRFTILETHGVIKLVNFKGVPGVVPEWQIESLRKMLENPESLMLESYFKQGDLVEVVQGPFKGMRGTVVNRKGETRLLITIDGIMQTVSVEIDADNVEAVKQEMPA